MALKLSENHYYGILSENNTQIRLIKAAVSKLRISSVQCESPQWPGQGGGAARYRCRSLNNLLKIRINGSSLHTAAAQSAASVGPSWVPGAGHFWFLSPGIVSIGTAAPPAYLITIITLAARTPRPPAP